jgi:predicted phage tail protein
MSQDDLIIGAGGGGGKGGGGTGGTPSEAKDNLESTAYAQVIDLISEGEIEGFATPSKAGLVRGTTEYNTASLKDIYLDNTPILRASASNSSPAAGSYNFKNVTVHTRFGTGNQGRIPFGDQISEEVGVGLAVEKDVPITRTITDTNVDQVRVTLSVPQLQKIQDDGDIVGSSVRIHIQRQYAGGGFTTVVDDTLTGRTADQYQRDYLIDLRGQDPSSFPVDIRIVRVTDDADSAKISNGIVWTSYTEIVQAKLNYPHSALVGLRIDAEQFRNVPSRSYLVRGLKVRIPSNATVSSATGRLVYSGTWNGTFQAAQWTSDPAWCLWDLLTKQRYGLGSHIKEAQLDKWAFYSASQYCSALVPDGFGGTEPRFSCNASIQAPTDAYKLINDLCSVFRAMPYWSTGALTISQDRPADPSYLFTLANVAEEGFSYSGSDIKTRPNVVVVQYLDLKSRDAAYEQVEDRTAIQRYGVIKQEVTAFACTSRGQAARIGEWILYAAQYETEVVSFTASIEAGVVVRPGQVIEIADPVRAGARRGGRIMAASTTQITIDSTEGVPSSGEVSVILPDGTIETRSGNRVGTVVTLSSALSKTPNVGSVWVFRSGGGIQTSYWRVLTVEEQDGTQYAVTALSYNASKYDFIERDRKLQFRDVTNLGQPVEPPTNLSLTETLYEYQGQVRAKILISWKPRVGVNQYRVRWRKTDSNWDRYTTQSPDHEVLNITPGVFTVQVYSLDAFGRNSSTALEGVINALGKTAPPSNVTNFQQVIDPDIGVQLQWSPVADLDLRDYEIRQGGTTWDDATFVTRVAATAYKLGILQPGSVTYRIKARDTSNVYSATDATRTVTITAADAPTISSTIEDPVVSLTWSTPRGSYSAAYYDLRYGASWASGVQIAQVKGNAYNLPVTWSGTRTFWVAAVDPVGTVGAAGSRVVTINSAAAPTISAAFYGRSCTLTWNAVNGTLGTRFYEISYGSTYATRTVITRISSDGTGYSLPADWSGARKFWVVAVDGNGNLGTAGSVDTNIVPAPAPSLTTLIVGEYAQISWTPVRGTLETAYYEVRRGSTWTTAPVIGRVNSTFIDVKVDWVGTQRFLVRAVDINGLYGAAGG